MAIELIENQQFVFEEIDNCCDDNKRYLQKIADGDDIFIQFKQLPCSDNILCDFDFFGEELVEDGDFETNPVLSGWTLGTNWIWDSVNKFIRHQNGSIGTATYAVPLTNGADYFLSFDIEFLIPHASQSMTPSVGGTAGAAITTDGHYSMVIAAGVADTITFLANQFTDCSIDNVSLKLYTTDCWDFDDTDIALSESGACHISLDVATISQTGILVIGVLYKVVIVISGMTTGSVTIYGDTVASVPITANGEQTVFIIADGNDFIISMSADFDGCVNDAKVYALRQDFQFVLKDIEGNLIADLNPEANPSEIETDENDFVTFKLPVDSAVLDTNGDAITVGCYKICMYDPCLSSIESFAGRGDADSIGFSQWTPSNPDIINSFIGFRGWLMVSTGNGDGTAIISESNAAIAPINNWTNAVMQMLVQVDFTTGAIANGTNRVYINLPNNQKILIATNVAANTSYSFHSILITVDNTGGATYQNQIRIICEFDSTAIGNENEIRALIVTTIPMTNPSGSFTENGVEKCSNPLQYAQAFDTCDRMLKGMSDEDYSLGFYFGGIFELKNRLSIKMVTPSYPKEMEEELFSDGHREMTFGQGEKYWTVKVGAGTEGVDEVTHDNINAMLLCDTLVIDGADYFPKKDEYKPNWDQAGERKLAESEFLVKKKNKTIFNRNV